MFAQFPSLRFAGYVIVQGRGIKAANWIIPDDQVNAFHKFARPLECNDYEVAVYAPGTNRHGGQCEQRVI